jgi:hypothetical protein
MLVFNERDLIDRKSKPSNKKFCDQLVTMRDTNSAKLVGTPKKLEVSLDLEFVHLVRPP